MRQKFESKYQLRFNGKEKVGIEILRNPKAFTDYSQTIDDVYENLEDYNPTNKRRVLLVFDDMTTYMESIKKLNSIVTELFVRGRKLNIAFVFISWSYFKVPKTIRLNVTHHFIMSISSKRELQQIASNHSSDIDFKDLMKLYKVYIKDSYPFLVNDMTLSSENPLQFWKKIIINEY